MQGTPYIYQGEEIGMKNVQYEYGEYRDIETINMYKERLAKGFSKADIMDSIHARSRDNARTPMQWNDGMNAGFSCGIPWIKVNPDSVSYTHLDVYKRQGLYSTHIIVGVDAAYKAILPLNCHNWNRKSGQLMGGNGVA